MLASHNLSKAAWGHLQRRDSQLMVHSFEMGVLFVPDLELLYRQHRHHGYCCSTGACRISSCCSSCCCCCCFARLPYPVFKT